MYYVGEETPPTPEFWRQYVFEKAQGRIRSLDIIPEMERLGKTPPVSIPEVVQSIRALVPYGRYRMLAGPEQYVLGVAAHSETSDFYAIILDLYGCPKLIPLLEFLSLENSTCGDKVRYGIKYLPQAPQTLQQLASCWLFGGGEPHPGYARLWKNPEHTYAVFGSVDLVSSSGRVEKAALYVPLYGSDRGNLFVRPVRAGGNGFLDDVRDRLTDAGTRYSGTRFIYESSSEVKRADLFKHILLRH